MNPKLPVPGGVVGNGGEGAAGADEPPQPARMRTRQSEGKRSKLLIWQNLRVR